MSSSCADTRRWIRCVRGTAYETDGSFCTPAEKHIWCGRTFCLFKLGVGLHKWVNSSLNKKQQFACLDLFGLCSQKNKINICHALSRHLWMFNISHKVMARLTTVPFWGGNVVTSSCTQWWFPSGLHFLCVQCRPVSIRVSDSLQQKTAGAFVAPRC